MFKRIRNFLFPPNRLCKHCGQSKPKAEVSEYTKECDACFYTRWEEAREAARLKDEEKKQRAEQAKAEAREDQKNLIKEAVEEWYIDRLAREEAQHARETQGMDGA